RHHLLASKLSFRHVHQGVKNLVKLHSDSTFQDFLTEGGSPPAIISLCPILRDPFSTKGYINQDFGLLFNAETSNKLLERRETAFKQEIFNEAQSLTSTAEIWCLLNAAGGHGSENDWDSDVICPAAVASPAPGRKKAKMSPTEAVDRLVHFHKSCTSIEGHLSGREGHQSFLLGSGRIEGRIDHLSRCGQAPHPFALEPAPSVPLNFFKFTMSSACPTWKPWCQVSTA
uniref:Uncharacterized protein n=1 Tax=Cyprinus carpio carpio TaxID=630221 RepID=A0A9J7YMJ8_CYPCA